MTVMTNRKQKIGVSLRIVNAQNYEEERDALSHDWTSLLEDLGFISVHIPNTLKNLDSFLDEMNLDGIVLSGGDNIGDNKKRDETENNKILFDETKLFCDWYAPKILSKSKSIQFKKKFL